MKFNRKNPSHYLKISIFSFVFLITFFISLFVKRKNETIFLLGHHFNGNLEGFYNRATESKSLKYLTFDYKFSKKFKDFKYIFFPNNIFNLLNSKIVIASHGILFHRLLNLKKIKTYHIGHGVQTSITNFNKSEYYLFDEIWLSSDMDRNILINDCNYKSDNLFTTGFIRIENTKRNEINREKIKRDLGLNLNYCLYAPTATGKIESESLNNFQFKNLSFLKELNRLSGKIDVKTIIKLHYNDHVYNKVDKKIIDFIKNSENLIYFKNLNLENNQDLLNIVDFLITDWSSIYIDFLPLKKPIIFLDAPLRRKNINLSKFMINRNIQRISTIDALEEKLFNIYLEDNQNMNELELEIFENKYDENIFSRYESRLWNH